MNERIQELVGQAKFMAEEDINKQISANAELNAFAEKFAELIVQECAELSVNSQYANTKSEYYEGFNEALVYAGNKIRKHFGVEE